MIFSSSRILILDGAMGTMLQRYHLTEKDFCGERFNHWPVRLYGNNDLISLTRPDILHDIHRQYLEAGADIITTNTFNAQRISQADYQTEKYVAEINRAAARIARSETNRMTQLTPNKPRYVVASIGPTNKTLSLSPDVENPAYRAITFDELCDAYTEQMTVLAEEKVDVFLCETIFDTLNAKAAVEAARRANHTVGTKIPVMLSLTIADASGRSLSGQSLEAFATTMVGLEGVISIGLNCSFGADDMRPYLKQLSAISPCYITAHPNAGLPNEEGLYTQTPDEMAQAIRKFIDDGSVNIVGGCCGSTPEHIRAIANIAEGRSPRSLPTSSHLSWLAGLDAFSPLEGAFVNVGERCNVAGSRKFLRLIKEHNYDEALKIARKQVHDGAMMLDINMDDGLLDSEKEMSHFLNLLASDPEVARIPWMIDSSRFSVIDAALKRVQGKCVVNSISLKEGEEIFLNHARQINEYGAAMVVMAFDEKGQATTYDRKIAVCERAYQLLTQKVGVCPQNIIFDPNILTVATGIKEHNQYALDYIKAVAWIRQHLPGVHISGGVSNLSFAFRGNNYLREAMHAVFLFHAIRAGMDMGIVNPATKVMYSDIAPDLLKAIEDVILCRCEDAAEKLIDRAQILLEEIKNTNVPKENMQKDRSSISIEERLMTALRAGDDEFLEEDLAEALTNNFSPTSLIEDPLMQGMQCVGNLFGEGKMFLPQVVKSARTMKKAVAWLQPYLEASKKSETNSLGRYVIATVKGDVHDIGKNIVSVVLACNNFEVIDLGVMVTAEQIVKAVKEKNADFVALSGLITPSLDEMCHIAQTLTEAGISVPLFIGGATTSDLHTALKIAPLYKGAVFHVKDAAQNPILALRLLGSERNSLIAENTAKQAALVAQYKDSKKIENQSVLKANENKKIENGLNISWENETLTHPKFLGCRTLPPISIKEVKDLINWSYFYHFWRIKSHTDEAKKLRSEAESLMDELQKQKITTLAQVAFYEANSTGNGIEIKDAKNFNGKKKSYQLIKDGNIVEKIFDTVGSSLHIETPRQEFVTSSSESRLALCDFVAPAPFKDYIGCFAVTISSSFLHLIKEEKEKDDTYRALLLQSVADRLAEATAEWLHREVRKKLWGYAPTENLTPKEMWNCAYQGIRPAVGYPSFPDQRQIFKIAYLMDFPTIGLYLTENGAMFPQSSICGLLFSSSHSRYFSVRNEHN